MPIVRPGSTTPWLCRVRLRSEDILVPVMLALLGAGATAQPTVAYAVVVSEDVPLTDITLDELRRVFLLERIFWKPGRPVRLMLPATGQPARNFLLERVCLRAEPEFRRHILAALYRGDTDRPPKSVVSDAEALSIVAAVQGSVALVSAEIPLRPGTRTVRVNGKLPSEPGYPLAP